MNDANSSTMVARLFFSLVTVAFSLNGCTSGGSRGADTPLSYGEDAQVAYEDALRLYRRGDCINADPKFQRVRREFPYSRFAALAELRSSDCLFKEEKYSEAIQGYRQFVRVRPSHTEVPYARFRIAESYYRQIPSGWFMTPPSHERDQGPARDALTNLRRFVVDFPGDERVPEAKEMIDASLKLLAEHEYYVAKFYRRRDAHNGVISRLTSLLTKYPGTPVEPDAMLMLAKTYLDTSKPSLAKETLSNLVDRFPETKQAKKARGMLRKL